MAGRFSLVAAAGEIATALGILPWKEGEATSAAGECFQSWLSARGHAGAGEDEQAIEVLRRFIVANASSRFSEIGVMDDLIRDRVGWRKLNPDGIVDLFIPVRHVAECLQRDKCQPCTGGCGS